MLTINIAKEFSDTPGPRYIKDGEYSGEEFREKLLLPLFEKAIDNDEKLQIDFDGGYGYPSSFLEEAFGGLARIYPKEKINATLCYISTEEPTLISVVKSFIDKANRL